MLVKAVTGIGVSLFGIHFFQIAAGIAAGNGSADEAFLITLADAPRLEVGFARDPDRLSTKLLWPEAQGSPALFDAVYAGLYQMHRAANPRKALVVVTDGGDNKSRYSFDELRAAARESDVQIYTVAIRRNRGREEQRGRVQLDLLAGETGGQLLVVEGEAELSKAMASVNELIRNEYLLAYRPPDAVLDGTWHRVWVRPQPERTPHYRIHRRLAIMLRNVDACHLPPRVPVDFRPSVVCLRILSPPSPKLFHQHIGLHEI